MDAMMESCWIIKNSDGFGSIFYFVLLALNNTTDIIQGGGRPCHELHKIQSKFIGNGNGYMAYFCV
jgi:hypothetical protein